MTTSVGAPGRWGMLALIVAAQTMANVGPLGIPSIAPLIRQDLGLSMAQAGSFLSAYYIGAAIMSLPAGWMGDRWGVLATMVIGQALISAGLSGVAGSVSFWLLTLIMIVAGAGYGMLNPTTAKAAMAWFPRRQRATAVGFKQVGLPLGGAVGALIMPHLGLSLGWRPAVMMPAALVAVVGLLTWILYRDPPDSEYAARGTAGGPSLAAVLANRDLWLVALSTLIFAGMQKGYVALYQKCVHLGCRVPWCFSSQWFECPCHGSQYNRVGEKKGGPAPRGLDRFAVSVNSDGTMSVNTQTVYIGPPIGTNTTGQEAEGPHCR